MVKQAVCFAEFLSESAPSHGSLFFREVIQRSYSPHDQKRYWIVLYKARAKKNLVSITVCNLMIAWKGKSQIVIFNCPSGRFSAASQIQMSSSWITSWYQ